MLMEIKPGWISKGRDGLYWFSAKPCWNYLYCEWEQDDGQTFGAFCIVDPWPDKPDGGPECILEIR